MVDALRLSTDYSQYFHSLICVIAPTTAALGNQRDRAVALEGVHQPADMPRRQAELFGGIGLGFHETSIVPPAHLDQLGAHVLGHIV